MNMTDGGGGDWLSRPRWQARRAPARRFAGLVVLAAAGAALLLPPAARGWKDGGWGGERGAAAPTAGVSKVVLTDQFLAVSCPSRRACVAVGIASLNNQAVLAERWNGSQWSTTPVPVPAGTTGSGLTGVSCLSASACTAVGFYSTASGSGPLAERWNGQTWTIQQTPSPGRGGIPFAGVSCPSATSCTAVGYYDFGDVGFTSTTLVEHWDGTSWAIQPTPPIGDPGSDLTSVSCPATTLCVAAGYFLGQSDQGPGSAPLAMNWPGTSWAIQPTPGAGNATANETTGLSAVSCPAASACTAVGEGISGGPLALSWNGTRWRAEAVGGSTRPPLSGVSCSSATACTAVAGILAPLQGFVERWNGSTWSLQHLRMPSGANAIDTGAVSCPSAGACVAVGHVATKNGWLTLAERWNGRTWAVQPTQSPPPS
jgi:hypothetical protein